MTSIKKNARVEIDIEKLTIAVYNAGYDYTAFAEQANISYSTFNRIMNGIVTKPKSQTIKDICRVLKIDDVRNILKVKKKSYSLVGKNLIEQLESKKEQEVKSPIFRGSGRVTLQQILGNDYKLLTRKQL